MWEGRRACMYIVMWEGGMVPNREGEMQVVG